MTFWDIIGAVPSLPTPRIFAAKNLCSLNGGPLDGHIVDVPAYATRLYYATNGVVSFMPPDCPHAVYERSNRRDEALTFLRFRG